MSKKTKEAILELIYASADKMSDSDQRSALGCARRYMAHGKILQAHADVAEMYASRDRLVRDLIEVVKDAKPSEAKNALDEAREWVNTPFIDSSMAKYQADRQKRGAVGSEKKNEKLGLD